MSNGKTHEKVNIMYLVFGVAIVFTYFMWDLKTMLFIIAGYVVGTYWMNPDLDIRSKPYNNWLIFKYLWKPYQKLGHRSIWTHGYVIGDIIRYLYLYLLFILISYGLSFVFEITVAGNIEKLKSLYETYKTYFLLFVAGNMLSSAAHIFQDHLSTGIKKMKRKVFR